MISMSFESIRFNYRVAGVCVEDDYVLANRNESDDFWYLPGGRCELMEPSPLALERELREELGIEARSDGLLWVAENFFTLQNQRWHEIGLYHRFTLPPDSRFRDKTGEFSRTDEIGLRLIFKWLPIGELKRLRLQPSFLIGRLAALPTAPAHIIHHDEPI